MEQDFRPIAIGGSHRSKAVALAEKIAEEDYGVADFKSDGADGAPTKVRYRDQRGGGAISPAEWHGAKKAHQETLAQALAIGKQTRRESGGVDGLDILQKNIREGTQPDLIENSKRISMKIW